MTLQSLEAQVLAKVADDYRDRGYDVAVKPRGPGLPAFLEGLQPDLIARRGDESVVVGVQVGTRTSVAERLRDLAERISRQPGWRFSLVFADPERPDQVTEAQTLPLAVIQERVQSAEALFRSGQRDAAFLLLWSGLEGLLRFLGERAQLPLTSLPSSALLRELYSSGELGREQYEALMRLLPARNQLVHGVTPHGEIDVEALHGLVTSLLEEASRPA